MKQAIAGVTPAADREVTVTTVWPSVAAMSVLGIPLGLVLGKAYAVRSGPYIFTVGNLMCLLSIPLAIVLYFKRIGPIVATRYRVTNRRVVVERGMMGREERSIDLDQFDSVEVVVRPGQEWYDAGDLVFRQGKVEKFLLPGVSRPEAFRQVCLKACQSYSSVKQFVAA